MDNKDIEREMQECLGEDITPEMIEELCNGLEENEEGDEEG